MKILGVTGRSGSGKTFIIERLVGALFEKGISVAYVKHSHHPFHFGPEGKDTSRVYHAGARRVYFIGENVTVDIRRRGKESPKEMINQLEGIDIVVVEGFGEENFPSIEITDDLSRSDHRSKHIVAFISEDDKISDVPVFSSMDIESVTSFVIDFINTSYD